MIEHSVQSRPITVPVRTFASRVVLFGDSHIPSQLFRQRCLRVLPLCLLVMECGSLRPLWTAELALPPPDGGTANFPSISSSGPTRRGGAFSRSNNTSLGITNALIEGLSSVFSAVKRKSRSFPSIDDLIAMLYFQSANRPFPVSFSK